MKTIAILLLLINFRAYAQTSQDTLKGSITPERAWWDVLHYSLTIRPDYTNKTLTGKNIIRYKVIAAHHTPLMQIDLQPPLTIDSILSGSKKLPFQQNGSAWMVTTPTQQYSSIHEIAIYYSGKPKESVNPPWDGGVVWTNDSLDRPWMAVACQLVGASIWYPCKVYQGDEPDNGATINLIIPDTLIAVANGRLKEQHKNRDHTIAYQWEVKNPINNYCITFYIGKYISLQTTYAGEKGPLDLGVWVLDYNRQKAIDYLLPEIKKTLPTFEHWFGPYPFYEDGFKMVESPYIGMEHQGAVGYGNHFQRGRYKAKRLTYWDMKTDRMVVHENAHEWFGNNITARDPADGWIQEGFTGYAEELVMEDWYGKPAADTFFTARTAGRFTNEKPVIGQYNVFDAKEDGDPYLKGWALVHLIRARMHDDEKFRQLLRTLNSHFYHQTVTSAQVEAYIISYTGIDFSKVFDQYLRTTQPIN
jgi:aminopeptidase N